jgi:hypothetical protein
VPSASPPLVTPGRATGRRRSRGWGSAATGVVVGTLVVLAIFAAGGWGVLSHTECMRGTAITNEGAWTPFSLVNAPYLGSTVYRAQFMNWGLFGWTNVTIGPPGSLTGGNISAGYFETQNWTVFTQSNRSEIGPGLNQPCRAGYAAAMSHTTFDVSDSGFPLQGPGNTSNADEPTSFSGNGSVSSQFPSAVFANGFGAPNRPSVSTRGQAATERNFSSTSFDVSLTVTGSEGPITTTIVIISNETYTYYFPANGGTWQVDDLQLNAGLRGPGLAFSWQPC